MALKDMVRRLTASVDDLDAQRLCDLCDGLGLTPIPEVELRRRTRVGGEISSVRVVPRAGAPALEVTITDGRGSVTAVFLGRRQITGISPGCHVAIDGVPGRKGGRLLVFNPSYTLLP